MNNNTENTSMTKIPFASRPQARKWLGIGLTAVALVFGALCVTGFGQKHYRLGGAWVGGSSTYTWTVMFAPSDPQGQTAAARPILKYFNDQFAGLLATFGADNLSDATGEAKMISQDTAQWTLISYMQVTPHQPGEVLQNKATIVSHGTWKFGNDNTAVLNYTLDVYPPSADADGDGLPDAGTQPILSIPTLDNARRVPIL